MAVEFTLGYYVLVGLVVLESLAVFRVLARTASIFNEVNERRMARLADEGGPERGVPVPQFSARLCTSGAKVSDKDLLGETSALIFVETSEDRSSSLRMSEEAIKATRSLIKGAIIVACCGGGCRSWDEPDATVGGLQNTILVDDHGYLLASQFKIRAFPTLVTLNKSKKVIGVGTFSLRTKPYGSDSLANSPQLRTSESE